MYFLRTLICLIAGHKNTDIFADGGGRVWQQCGRCGGWLGWMFHWKYPWRKAASSKAPSSKVGE